jgi:acyl carrier protein
VTTTVRRATFVAGILAWINQRLVAPGVVVRAATPLFASGTINSIKVLELIAWTERAIGREIEDHEIRLDNFYSVQRIADVFAEEASHATV